MATATDLAGIQFRVLNARKGPAVRATRAQADRVLYRNAIRQILFAQENLTIFQDAVDDIELCGDQISGITTSTGIRFQASACVLTAGTSVIVKFMLDFRTSQVDVWATLRLLR
jgi:tRNA uridine 5-carboxymethylaminomethyl modification enzyme